MKADEYIAQVRELTERGEPDREIVQAVVMMFIAEASDLTKQRAGKRGAHDGIAVPVLRELDAKWMKVARAIGWNPRGWREFWASKGVTF